MKIDWLSVVLILVALAATAAAYPYLPSEVQSHWTNLMGQADEPRAKSAVFSLVAVIALVYILLSLFPRYDRRRALAARPEVYRLFVRAIVLFLVLMQLGSLAFNLGYAIAMVRLVGVALGLLLVVFGNHLPQVKANTFLGIRTPWTLKDETTWRVTNRLGGYLFMLGGVLLVALSLVFGPTQWVVASIIGVPVIAGALSVAYSYFVYSARRAA
jgi:uncharacterized membrane protein